jgi:hypothetical protein
VKKFLVFTLLLFSLGICLPQSASAAIRTVELVERPHQLLDGRFIDDELATLLSPEGRLGSLVYTPIITETRWIIDAALLDEVADMADGYELADNKDGVGVEAATAWLAQLRIATAGGVITPVAYGNPDLRLAKRLAPSELRFYQKYGADRVAFHLGRAITPNRATFKPSTSKLSGPDRKNYTVNRQAISKLSTVVTAPELELFVIFSVMALVLSFRPRGLFSLAESRKI